MNTYYIGADTHSNNTELAIEKNGVIIDRYSVPTTIPAIAEVLSKFKGKKHLIIEEGPMADWLYHNLKSKVDQFIVSDPRRNKIIYCDGDKDDKIDSAKLPGLLRGGHVRAVHHSDNQQHIIFKQWVSLYDDRISAAVANINKIRARCRMHGLTIPRQVVRDPDKRAIWIEQIKNDPLAKQLNNLWVGYDANVKQVINAKAQLAHFAANYDIIQAWRKLPGVGLIRAVTFFVYLDTPFRFSKKSKLWKYAGVGLQRATSAKDKKGQPNPAKLKLPWNVNHRLKNAIIGTAISAVNRSDNVFKDYYTRMINHGVTRKNAQHSVARKMLTVMWGMWKSNQPFDPKLCCSDEFVGSTKVYSN